MAKKNFILLSMEDDKIRKISNVIGNDSCRKILDFLAEREATESELAEKLGIPISTVHYNLNQLVETGLIESNSFHYSEKGKEVSHFRLANKYIIIAPRKTHGIKEKLKGILPAALIVGAAAFAIDLYNRYVSSKAMSLASEAAPAMRIAADEAEKSAPQAASGAIQIAQSSPSLMQNIAVWFFAGAMFALLAYFIIGIIRKDVD